MSRFGSSDPFYKALDERTSMGPGVRAILSTPLRYDDSALAEEARDWARAEDIPCVV